MKPCYFSAARRNVKNCDEHCSVGRNRRCGKKRGKNVYKEALLREYKR